jgi:hypothetical protein
VPGTDRDASIWGEALRVEMNILWMNTGQRFFFGETEDGADTSPPAIGHYGTVKKLTEALTELQRECVPHGEFQRNVNGDSRIGRNE